MKQMCVTVKGQPVLLDDPKQWTISAIKVLVQHLKHIHSTTDVEVSLIKTKRR